MRYFIGMIMLILAGALPALAAPGDAPAVAGAAAGAAGNMPVPLPQVSVGFAPAQTPEEVSLGLQIVFLLTILSLAPSIIMMMTSFTRVYIVLNFLQRALGTQQLPPQQILVGLSLFLTFFIMAPTFSKINQEGVQPYLAKQIDQKVAIAVTVKHMRIFMFRQTYETDIALFTRLGNLPRPANRDQVPTYALVPAFMISELKTAFTMGVLLFIPFMVIDMVVSSVLMSMGMIMLPPVMISLPFKILLFIMVDGWNLLVGQIVASYHLGA